MSSVANNHGTFGQQSLIPSQKSQSTSAISMAFLKRESGLTHNPDCYTVDNTTTTTTATMRARQAEYPGWSPLPNPNSSQWTDISCDSTLTHVGSLPAAHSLVSHPSKGNAPTTTSTVMTNQNGKTFTAPSASATPVGNYHGYEEQHQHYSPPYQLRRGASYSGPRPAYLEGQTTNVIQHMEYADGQGDPYHAKSNPAFHSLTSGDMPSYSGTTGGGFRYANTRDDKSQLGKMPGHFQSTVDPMSVSPSASLRSSDGETTASSSATRGANSLSVTGGMPNSSTSAVAAAAAAASVISQPKRTRKPAPTLATGRRNLKSEPVSLS